MYFKSLSTAVAASLGLASSAQAAIIDHETSYFVPITIGHPFFVDRYKVIVEKGDTLDSIARQFEEMDVADYGLTGTSPITADKLRGSNPGLFPDSGQLHRGVVFRYNRRSVVPVCNNIL